MRNDLAKALHTIEDSYSPSHFGYQRWDGGWNPLHGWGGVTLAHIPSLQHMWNECPLSDDVENVPDAVDAASRYLREYMTILSDDPKR
jgi:hypothetical protein